MPLFPYLTSPGVTGTIAVTGGSGGPTTNVNLEEVNGDAFALGQQTMAGSLPVAIASDQTKVPTNLESVNGAALSLGQGTKAASLPVTLASDQGVIAAQASDGTHTAAVTPSPAAGSGNGIAAGAQVDLLGGMTIASAVVNVSASGSTAIIAGVAGKMIYVLHWFLIAAGAVTATWEDGASTPVSGPMVLVANSGVSAGSGLAPVLMTKTAGDSLELNLSSAVTVGGVVIYGVK